MKTQNVAFLQASLQAIGKLHLTLPSISGLGLDTRYGWVVAAGASLCGPAAAGAGLSAAGSVQIGSGQ